MSSKAKKRITLFSHADCEPCKLIADLVQKGQIDAGDAEELDVVDIDTDEGFTRFEKEILAKLPEDGKAPLPGAYMAGQLCEIKLVDDDKYVIFECPNPVALPSEQPGE